MSIVYLLSLVNVSFVTETVTRRHPKYLNSSRHHFARVQTRIFVGGVVLLTDALVFNWTYKNGLKIGNVFVALMVKGMWLAEILVSCSPLPPTESKVKKFLNSLFSRTAEAHANA